MSGCNIAFIPFRSGSTRLPNKNILPLAGLPLATWSLIAANKCKFIDKIILSTDQKGFFDQIVSSADEVIKINKEILFDHRLPEHAGSRVKIFDYIKNHLKESMVNNADSLVQMLPTTPFRSVDTLQKAIELYLDTGIGNFSAAEYSFRVSFAFTIENGQALPLFDNNPMITGDTQSQNHPLTYHPCGAFNIFKMNDARNNMITIYDKCEAIIVKREESFDIDTLEDYTFMNSIAHSFKSKLLS